MLIAFAVFALVKVYTRRRRRGVTRCRACAGLARRALVHVIVDGHPDRGVHLLGLGHRRRVNEESDDPSTTPGRAAVLSTVLLLVTYALVSVATVAFAGVGTEGIGLGNPDNADDVFAAIGPRRVRRQRARHDHRVPADRSRVLTSASASTQTTILPTARTALSMAAYRAIPPRFAKIHPRYLTPSDSTIGMGVGPSCSTCCSR